MVEGSPDIRPEARPGGAPDRYSDRFCRIAADAELSPIGLHSLRLSLE